jgi:putative DNA primase/helicase
MSSADGEQAQVEFIVLREVFRREVCQGFDADAVAKLLRRRGHLVHEPDRLTTKHRLPGIGKAPCFHIKPSVFGDDL